MAATELLVHIQAALQCITSPSSPPGMIQQAQAALLQWEDTHTDDYVAGLMSLVGSTSDRVEGNASVATLRLAAVLTLKAAIVRRWKDKGRGKVGVQKSLLSDGVKTFIRQSMLNLILTGKVDCQQQTNQTNFITNPNEITSQQLELLQDRPLQTNAASLLSKIARMDLPLKFQELIPTLVEGVKCSQGVVCQIQQQQQQTPQMQQQQRVFQTIRYNTMVALEAILSEISTQRLLVDRKYRNSIALQYLGSIVESGLVPSLQDLESLKGVSNGMGEEHISALKYATLASRVVSYMMVSSFGKLVEETATTSLVDQTLSLVHSFLSQWLPFVLGHDKNATNCALRKTMKELLHVHCDLIVNLQCSHPIAFVRYLNPFLTLFHSSLMYIVSGRKEANHGTANASTNMNIQSSDQYTIAFLSFLANVVGTSKYSESDAAKNELTSFFTPSLIQSLSQTLLHLFSIHIYPNQNSNDEDDEDDNAERVQWQDDPEGFYQYEMQRSSEDDVGCASQNLFLALVESSFSSEIVMPWLMQLLSNVASQRLAVEIEGGISAGIDARILLSAMPLGAPPTKLSHGENAALDLMLQWDAIYTAAGLAGSMLESCPGFHFRTWFDASLGPCLVLLLQSKPQQQTQLPILRRRIIWLLSCNAHQVTISSPLNPLGMLASALSAENDITVRLTCVQAMDALLPQCEGSPSLLHSIVEPTAPALYRLTNECTEVESRSSCLDLLSNLVTYVGMTGGSLTNETLNTIVTPLSSIWDNATDQNLLLKRNVLTILSCIVSFVGPESCSVLYPLALPLIDDSFARNENVFLVEEALTLTLTFLRLSNVYDTMLGKLFIRAVELSKDLEYMMIISRITEHYIILGGARFLNDHATTIQMVLSNIVGEVRPRGTAYIFLPIEALLCSFPVEGASLLQQCGVLKIFMEACASNYFEDDKCEPDRVIVLYLTALARILLVSPSTLQTLLPLKLPSGADFGEEELISLYLLKFQVAGNGAHGLLFQKSWALLLVSFYPPCQLTSCYNIVLGKSNAIFSKVIYLLQNMLPDGTNVLSYEVGYDEEEETVDIGADMHGALLQEQRTKDMVFITSLHEVISTKMNGIPHELGPQKYQDFLSTNDTLRQLDEALTSNPK
mmetsp:Transcript_14453/g.31345  ORF Transcript_14453/g.31345 Transcript_14453/m.31345 type:complete len:1131 (-) Transcript_14453:272-3664(-)|eukprot:CAMPEP_0172325522 /NCGR_PEP_ID=MMETSP1058-20130122/54268_1 /TAXON_ID=83371 /ORGANISM="Detonula confervacea, Strain CCMP 353" /LENGTH=1130 /DNA_ID=CAMNT_0013042099 /DNA_START=58 /DNA_END=3453 /DNA_ORIENTATION=-